MNAPAFDPTAAAAFDGIFGLPYLPNEARVVLVPVPWEPTTSYGSGASQGPAAIIDASKQVDLFDLETGKPYEAGIAILDADADIVAWNAEACSAAEPIIQAGGHLGGDAELIGRLRRVNELSAKLNERVETLCRAWMEKGKLVGVIGGDHSAPFGCIKAHADRFPNLGILHIDAHADLRVAYEGFTDSHASIMHNVLDRLPSIARLVQVGLRDLSEDEHRAIQQSNDRCIAFFDHDIASRLSEGEPFARIAEEIALSLPDQVYVSFDIDGLDPALCPNTGTPVPGGLSFHQAIAIFRALIRNRKTIVGFDLNEVAPGPEGEEWNGNVGARLLYKMIGFALTSQ